MDSYNISDKHDFHNFLILSPSESTEEEQEFDFIDIFKNIFPPNSPESEINQKTIVKEPQEMPLKEPIFRIEKINKAKQKSNSTIKEIKNIESNSVKLASNQIFNLSKEETEEISNIICKDKKENRTINKKRKRPETEENSDKNKKKRKRPDNCRLKIGRHFFNSFLIKSKINSSLQNKRPNLYFEKFPQEFIYKIVEKKYKNYLGKTLEDLLTTKELYVKCLKKSKQIKKLSSSHEKENKKSLEIYEHNFNALKKLKSNFDNNNILEKSGLNTYLGMRYEELYLEYSKFYRYKKLEKLAESKDNYDEFQKLSEYKTFTGFFKE